MHQDCRDLRQSLFCALRSRREVWKSDKSAGKFILLFIRYVFDKTGGMCIIVSVS